MRLSRQIRKEDAVKGFEQENGEYVVLSNEEIQNGSPEKSTTIDILEFVDEAQIPSLYFDRPYSLEPEKSPAKALALFRRALDKYGQGGVAQLVVRDRGQLC